MKTLITSIICLSLIATAIPEELGKPKPQPEPEAITVPLVLACVVLTVGAVGAYVVFKASCACDKTGPVKLVLERSTDHSTWTPIATNTVTLNGSNPIEAFSDIRRNDAAFYRTRQIQ